MTSSTTTAPPSGDFHKFHRPDAGSRTVEGNTSGARAMRLERQREAEQKEFEKRKKQRTFEQTNNQSSLNIDSKFQPARIGSLEEQVFKLKTVGLVSAEDFMAATNEKRDRSKALLGLLSGGDDDDDDDDDDENESSPETKMITEEEKEKRKALKIAASKKEAKRTKKKQKEKKKRAALLSFQHDDDEEDIDELNDDENKDVWKDKNKSSSSSSSSSSSRNIKKDPTVDTSFLPDKEREEAIFADRKRLEKEWKKRQIEMKKEKLQITYSYWDGSGHRRSCTISKGESVGEFLDIVRKELCRDFRELSRVGSDALLYVKEDLILPHDVTFYDLIATKARGKSGPLFHFDVHEDIRTGPLDVRVEKVRRYA